MWHPWDSRVWKEIAQENNCLVVHKPFGGKIWNHVRADIEQYSLGITDEQTASSMIDCMNATQILHLDNQGFGHRSYFVGHTVERPRKKRRYPTPAFDRSLGVLYYLSITKNRRGQNHVVEPIVFDWRDFVCITPPNQESGYWRFDRDTCQVYGPYNQPVAKL